MYTCQRVSLSPNANTTVSNRHRDDVAGYASTTLGLGGSEHADSDVVNKTKWLGGKGGGPPWISNNDQWFPYWADGNVGGFPMLRM